jgi:hypothetical protein
VNLFEYGRFLHPSFGTDLAVMSVRCEAEFDQTLVFGFRVVDPDCDMAVPVERCAGKIRLVVAICGC